MDRRRLVAAPFRRAALSAAIAGFATAGHASTGPGVRLGSEFRANVATADSQNLPDVGMDADGDMYIVWGESSITNACSAIMLRRFPAGGTPSPAYQENASATDRRFCNPAIAVDRDGGRVVVWSEAFHSEGLTQPESIRVRRSSTSILSARLRVDSGSSRPGELPNVATSPTGEFVVAWVKPSGNGTHTVWARLYTDYANWVTEPLLVATVTGDAHYTPGVAMDATGDFVVAWSSDSGSFGNVSMRRYAANGTPLAAAQLVTPTEAGCTHAHADVAMEHGGAMVVAWTRACGTDADVHARRFSANGTPIGLAMRVNPSTAGIHVRPRVAVDADGDFTVTWATSDGSGYGVYARRYTDDATLVAGQQFRANVWTTARQYRPAIATDADGDFAIVWASDGQDGSSYGVYGTRWSGFEEVNLSTVLTDSPDPATTSQTIRYTATVSNTHPSTATTGVGAATGLTINFGATGGTLAGAAGTGWNCQQAVTTAQCRLAGPLAPASFASVGFDVTPDGTGTLEGRVQTTAEQWDATPGNDTDEEATTVTADVTPDPFAFTDVAGAAPDTVVASDLVTVTGIDAPVQASVSLASARIQVNGGAWSTGPVSVVAGDSVRVRLRSAIAPSTARSTAVTIGGVADTWTVTTAP